MGLPWIQNEDRRGCIIKAVSHSLPCFRTDYARFCVSDHSHSMAGGEVRRREIRNARDWPSGDFWDRLRSSPLKLGSSTSRPRKCLWLPPICSTLHDFLNDPINTLQDSSPAIAGVATKILAEYEGNSRVMPCLPSGCSLGNIPSKMRSRQP
jgi:hypothetical protein